MSMTEEMLEEMRARKELIRFLDSLDLLEDAEIKTGDERDEM